MQNEIISLGLKNRYLHYLISNIQQHTVNMCDYINYFFLNLKPKNLSCIENNNA